jgi:iron complex outermembrane receptor protein
VAGGAAKRLTLGREFKHVYSIQPSAQAAEPAAADAGAAAFALIAADTTASLAVTETVTVTARKREETLLEVPVAIQAFSPEDLQRYQASDLNEISELASQVLMFPATSGSGANFSVRGISATSLDPGVNTSVVINVDGMMINQGHIVRQAMFDVQSVEILKGPQALFFGKNSPAGVVSITSAGPGDEFEFIARLFYEFEADEFKGEAIVSGPINDKVGLRFAYQGTTMRGYLKNNSQFIANTGLWPREPYDFPGAADKRKGGVDEHVARLTLQLDPSDRFTATLKVLGSTAKSDGSATSEVIACGASKPRTNSIAGAFGLGAFVEDPFGDCKLDGVMSQGDLPKEIAANFDGLQDRPDGRPFTKYDSVLATLNMEYSLDNFTITSQTGIFHYDWVRWDNFDGTTYIQLMGFQNDYTTNWSQELRVLSTFDGPINFMIGGYYESTDKHANNQGKIVPLGPDPRNGLTNNWSGRSETTGDSYSFFGQLIWDITDNLELAGGARWSKEDLEMTEGNVFVNQAMLGPIRPGNLLFSAEGDVINAFFKDEDVSPEVTLTWNVTPDMTLYAGYKTGYKAGGFSTQTVIPPGLKNRPQDTVYGAESAEGAEIGLKSSLIDGRLALNVTAYRYNYKNLQVSAFDAPTVSFQIRNAASARIQGFEIESSFLATDELRLRGQVGYNHARYTDFPGAPCHGGQTAAQGCVGGVQDLTGKTLTLAPAWTASAGFSYDVPVANALMLGLTGDVVYVDGYQTQLAQNPRSYQKSTVRLNAGLRLYTEDERWEFAVIGRNLTNERYISGSADKPGGGGLDIFGTAIRARQIGIQATFRY